jgi:hypothetical protein
MSATMDGSAAHRDVPQAGEKCPASGRKSDPEIFIGAMMEVTGQRRARFGVDGVTELRRRARVAEV